MRTTSSQLSRCASAHAVNRCTCIGTSRVVGFGNATRHAARRCAQAMRDRGAVKWLHGAAWPKRRAASFSRARRGAADDAEVVPPTELPPVSEPFFLQREAEFLHECLRVCGGGPVALFAYLGKTR